MAIVSGSRTLRVLAIAGYLTFLNAATKPGSDRFRLFISDTHFGPGKVDGHWHNYEDARWAPEFAAFLEEMDRMGQGKADLIMNGDTFELWQSLDPNDCTVAVNKNLGCSEDGALKRLRRVLSSHQPELDAISKFAKSGDNKVIIVPGNHDAVLLFKAIAQEVLRAINAPAERLRIAGEGYWLSPDSLIYAEHGHQIGKEVNKFDNWPTPFIQYKGVTYLQRPWGEQFVQRIYNSFEVKYPIIDNLSENVIGVKYCIKAEGPGAVPKDIGRFVWFYLTKISWSQLKSTLGGDKENPEWNVEAIRQMGNRFLADSVPRDDAVHSAAQEQVDQGTFGFSLADLSDDDITEICNLRQRLFDVTPGGEQPQVVPCPKKNLGAIAQALFSSRSEVFEKHFDDTYARLDAAHQVERAFLLYVYSHTHRSDPGFYPLQASKRTWNPFVVNTGAWQRTVTPDQLRVIQKARNLNDKHVLTLQPEDLPACYPVILVEPYQSEPKSKLRFWRKKDDSWSLGGSCDVL